MNDMHISPKAPYITSMRIECAKCGRTMGWKDGQGQTGTTYTYCPECTRQILVDFDAEMVATRTTART